MEKEIKLGIVGRANVNKRGEMVIDFTVLNWKEIYDNLEDSSEPLFLFETFFYAEEILSRSLRKLKGEEKENPIFYGKTDDSAELEKQFCFKVLTLAKNKNLFIFVEGVDDKDIFCFMLPALFEELFLKFGVSESEPTIYDVENFINVMEDYEWYLMEPI